MKKKKLVSAIVVTKDRKDDLAECVESLFASSYEPLEVIIIDNASNTSVARWLKRKFPKTKVFRNRKNLGAAAGRNIGIKNAKGDYILFLDDDAKVGKDTISNLVKVFEKKKKAGVVQPKVYDKENPNLLQGVGHGINLLTGRIFAWGVREEDKGQYDELREIPMAGCVWMVKRDVIDKIGGYDEDYFIPYEDSDFSERARRAGFKVYCAGNASAWHKGHKRTYISPTIEWLGITSPERAFRVARNKLIFMYKHAPLVNFLFFLLVLFPLYTFGQSILILSAKRLDIFKNYWRGIFAGTGYVFSKTYKRIDDRFLSFKYFLMAWTDPLLWAIDKKGRTILDLGCGQGKPMILIKMRMKVKRAVGVDLFTPYLKEAKEQKIHDEYIISDIRKVRFKPRSFDIVLASHVLEHMPKSDALKVLNKMEKIAKRQVIVATPIGEMYHPAVDENIHQLHQSAFYPEEFEKRGYKIYKYGWRWLLGDVGIVHKVQNDIVRKILYTFNILVTPLYYLFPNICDYTFVVYKDMRKRK